MRKRLVFVFRIVMRRIQRPLGVHAGRERGHHALQVLAQARWTLLNRALLADKQLEPVLARPALVLVDRHARPTWLRPECPTKARFS